MSSHTLSDILSRYAFIEQVNRDYDRYFDDAHVMGYLHIHRLKYYNRMHGIIAGDEIVRRALSILQVASCDGLVTRYAGNGIVFLSERERVESLAAAINDALPTFGEPNGLLAKIGTIACTSPLNPEDCMDRAHFACDSITHRDEAFVCPFEGEVERLYNRQSYIVDHLDDAIAANEIQAWAQPIVRVLTGRICEVEVLARWESKRYGFLYPDEFIPVLEQRKLIHKLDLAVIRNACAQWSEASALGINVPFGINLSRLDFELCDIHAEVKSLTKRYGVPTDQIHIEITESSAISDDIVMAEGVRKFRDDGFQLYMDDFGSGYSSLGQMAFMDFDVIKFDKTMLDHVEDNERARAVLADTISMVKRLGMQTLCEGVETQGQLDFLQAIGCEKAQGFHFGRPSKHEHIMGSLAKLAMLNESPEDNAYFDEVGRINLLDGTSASIHGTEAATFLGSQPIAVLEITQDRLRCITSNIAFNRLVTRMGYPSFDDMARSQSKTAVRVVSRAIATARTAHDTGKPQTFDFIVGEVFCSSTMVFVTRTEHREAYLSIVTSVENAPQITEHTLLEGVLETSDLCFFWKDTQRRFLGVNQRFLDYYGFEHINEVLGKTDEDMGWHERNEPFHSDEESVLHGKVITAARGVCECRGELRDIIATKRPLYSNGAIVGLVGYFEDVGLHRPSCP